VSEKLLTRRQVEAMTGFRRSAIYARIAAGTFPAPRREPGCYAVRWLQSEVQAWIADWVSRSEMAGKLVGTKLENRKKNLKSAA